MRFGNIAHDKSGFCQQALGLRLDALAVLQ